ncbi:hypothetical protein ES703_114965 [subsurface metagenome]
MVMNYPRIIDQIKNIDKSQSEEFINTCERLGKDSFRHATIVTKLTEDLGGKPNFEMLVIERMIDVQKALIEQLEKEKSVMSIYQDAKRAAQANQAKAKGFFGKILSGTEESHGDISRSRVIEILTGLQNDEWGHIKRVQNALTQMNIKPD